LFLSFLPSLQPGSQQQPGGSLEEATMGDETWTQSQMMQQSLMSRSQMTQSQSGSGGGIKSRLLNVLGLGNEGGPSP
jgi:hypothetical protein